MDKIIEFFKSIWAFVCDNSALFIVIAALVVLLIVFICLFAHSAKLVKKYKPAFVIYKECQDKAATKDAMISSLSSDNSRLSRELASSKDLVDEQGKSIKAKSDLIVTLTDENAQLKAKVDNLAAENKELKEKYVVKFSNTTRSAELSLEDLRTMTKDDLLKIAKKRKMAGFTALSKDKLAEFIYNELHK